MNICPYLVCAVVLLAVLISARPNYCQCRATIELTKRQPMRVVEAPANCQLISGSPVGDTCHWEITSPPGTVVELRIQSLAASSVGPLNVLHPMAMGAADGVDLGQMCHSPTLLWGAVLERCYNDTAKGPHNCERLHTTENRLGLCFRPASLGYQTRKAFVATVRALTREEARLALTTTTTESPWHKETKEFWRKESGSESGGRRVHGGGSWSADGRVLTPAQEVAWFAEEDEEDYAPADAPGTLLTGGNYTSEPFAGGASSWATLAAVVGVGLSLALLGLAFWPPARRLCVCVDHKEKEEAAAEADADLEPLAPPPLERAPWRD